MKKSALLSGRIFAKHIFLMAMITICFALILSISFTAYADGIGGTAFTSDYTSQEEVYAAANEFNERLVEEGVVLLKNDDNTLPLATGSKVNVLGKNSAEVAIGGTGSSTGSGSVEAIKSLTLYEGLEAVGYELNPHLVAFYQDDTLSGNGRTAPNMGANLTGLATGETPQDMYSQELLDSYANYSDASIVVFTRIGGEGYDLPMTMLNSDGTTMDGSDEGDHYLELDLNEEAILASLEADPSVSNVIVIINASQPMELGFLYDSVNYSKIKAAIWVGGPGQSGVAAIGRILSGDVNPSGNLVDTYPVDFSLDPTWYNFGASGGQGVYGTVTDDVFSSARVNFVDYEEGIYLGYRYWETAGYDADDGWSWYDDNIVYPFGYGLSYTTFSWELVGSPDVPSTFDVDSTISLTVRVTNTGSVAGKDVVQLYYTAPYYDGGIEKSFVRLADFAKTPLLQPAETADVTLTVAVKDLASYDYDDANGNGFIGYELEAGDYIFRVLQNANARSTNGVGDITVNVPAVASDTATNGSTGLEFMYDEKTGHPIENLFDDVSQKAINGTLADPDTDAVKDSGGVMNVMTRATSEGGLAGTIPTSYPSEADRTVSQVYLDSIGVPGSIADRNAADVGQPWYKTEFPTQAEDTSGVVSIFLKDLIGLDYDDPQWDAFMDQMTYQEMATLIGDGAFHTIPIPRLGKPWSIEVDGPVGLVPRQVNGDLMDINDYVACVYATEPVVAATWNVDLVYEYGQMTGEEGIWGNTAFAYSGIYAPGLNIHRSQFSGRNFEYYSEDGVLSGKMAGKFSGGAYSKGLYTFMKHYALNDQETNRGSINTWADEQTMREIYLLPFEKAIKDGHSRGAMAAFNNIGNTWTGASYALMTELTRDEFGFDGMIITDWGSYSTSTEWMIRTGVDLLLGGSGSGVLVYEGEGLTATQAWALRRASKAIMFTVANSNAMIPRLAYNANTENADFQRGIEYTIDASGAMANYELDTPLDVTYSSLDLPSELTLDPATGIITGTFAPANPSQWWSTPPESYTFNVTASVPTGSTINTSVSQEFTINQASMSEVELLATGKVGQEYFSDAIQVDPSVPVDAADVVYELDPGLTVWTWVIREASDPLPDGLVLNPDGTITGTPTTAVDNVNIIVMVTAPGFVPAYINRTISILPADPVIIFEDALLTAGEVNAPYSATLTATGADTITFTSDDLPAGLTLNTDGTISGTPTATGTYVFTVTASAEGFDPVEASIVLNVEEEVIPEITFEDALLSAGEVGTAYSATLTATGAESITFASDDLPAGLTLNTDGTISGTPTTAGTYMFTVTASATGAQSAEASITISVAEADAVVLPEITFEDALLTAGQVDTAYSATLTATGADSITFTSDDLPAGLTLNTDGTISGTPTTAGTYMFTVTASATGAQSTDASVTINVAEADAVVLPEITFEDALLTAGQVDTAYSATLTATGADSITFTSDDLPAGLTLNSDGTISGTPTEAGTYLFTVTASAAGAQSAEASIALTVNDVAADTGCGSSLGISTISMAIISFTLAGAFVILRKRH